EGKLRSRPKVGVLSEVCGIVTASLPAPGTSVAGGPVDQVQLGIIRAHAPCRTGTGLPRVALPAVVARLAIAGNGVAFPHQLAGFLIVRFDEAADAVLAARNPGYHQILVDQRRRSNGVALLVIHHLDI